MNVARRLKQRVAIVGGGLGGLALGQALKSIPFVEATIFERDAAPTHRSQGYQIGIHGYGIDSLRSLNLPGLQSFLERNPMNGVMIGNGINQLDPWIRFPTPEAFLVNRWKLRDLLQIGITESIQWNKQFHHYEEVGEVVRVHFCDGTSIDCDLLVGADGVNSKVRQQYRPDLRFQSSGYGSIAGFFDPSTASEATSKYLADLIDWTSGNLVRLQLPDRHSFLCMRFIANNERPHLLWAVSYDRSLYAEGEISPSLTSEALKTLLQQRLSTAAGPIQELIALTSPENLIPQKDYLTMIPTKNAHIRPSSNHSKRVTLLGDAAHAMTSHAGLGANTAFKDAIELAKYIQDGSTGLGTERWSEGLRRYEKDLFSRGYKAVSLSLGNTKRIHSEPSLIVAMILKGIGVIIKVINYLRLGRYAFQ